MLSGFFGLHLAELAPDIEQSRLERDLDVDVCIVGAGLAGISTAYALRKSNHSVVVLDDGMAGGGETSRTTAHLSNAFDDRYLELEKLAGVTVTTMVAESHTAAINEIERLVDEESIDCAFERLDGFLFLPPGEDLSVLAQERDAARRAGIDVERLERMPGTSYNFGPCLRFPNQGQFDPMAFLAGLARGLIRSGGQLFTSTHVASIDTKKGLEAVTATGRVVRAKNIVIATNAPIAGSLTVDMKQAPYRTYAIAARIAPGSLPPGLYWDTSDTPGDLSAPYHYVRLAIRDRAQSEGVPGSDAPVVIIGGEDHRTGQADDGEARWKRLELWGRERFDLGDVVHKWSGQVMETPDGLALIGRSPRGPEGLYIITGDSGMGMTHSMIGSMIVSDLIAGRVNPWSEIYDPGRGLWRSAADLIEENVSSTVPYARWLKPGDAPSDQVIPFGEGATIRRGMHLCAVHRDASGRLHEFSAVCPHMSGIVRWNTAEKTWDCPCHGSRFDAMGHVVNGPANSDLTRVQAPQAV